MSPHHQHRRKTKYKSPSNNNAQTDEFLVFGYSAKLHNPCNELCPADDQQVFDENLYLIPWNGDDRLKIDRSLDEFDEKGQQKRGFLDNGGDEEEEGDKAEKLEEELCEEERFLDLYEDIRKRELEDANQKRGKGAEFGFIYEERDPEIGMVDVCEEATAEDERPYEQPPSLKLPLGIITPETMKQNAIIERTAQFVVLQGPQMEVVIKAKQRQNAEQFEFLDFDHRLHPYYKYMCKLIREKKYVPQPKQQLTKKKIVNDPSESESEIDSENEGDGYLHPSLLGGTSKAKADENALTKLGFIGPSPRPPPQKKEQKPASPVPDLDILVQQFHRSSNSNSLYSSLLKGLHSVLPGTSPKIDSAEKFDGEPSAAHVEENIPNIESVCIPSLFKTDQQQRSDDYNKWHMEFYGRPSPFLPGLPPVCQRPVPDSAVESAISVAAKYVALHGAYAEQRLIDHNQDKVHFLQARSPYYTFYQSQVRQIQWKIFHQSQQYRQQPFPVAPLFATTIGSVAAVPSPPPLSAVDLVAMSSQKPMAPAIEQKDDTEAKETEPDPKQLERREKARLFMEKILNERMAEKHRTKIKSNNFEENRDTGADSTTSLSATVSVQPIPSSTLSPLALSKAISTLIDEQIKRSLGTSPPHSPEERKKKSAKRTHDEERIRRKKKKRGRSHSFHSSSSSSTSSTSTASNKDTERSRKRRKSSRRRKRRRDHGSERDSGEGEKEERRQRRKRKHNGEEENSSRWTNQSK